MPSTANLFLLDSFYKEKGLVIRTLVVLWFLTSVAVVAVYVGTFTSLLALPRYQFLVNSIEEVVDKDVHVMVAKGISVEQFILVKKNNVK